MLHDVTENFPPNRLYLIGPLVVEVARRCNDGFKPCVIQSEFNVQMMAIMRRRSFTNLGERFRLTSSGAGTQL